jgi:hypothetical protein
MMIGVGWTGTEEGLELFDITKKSPAKPRNKLITVAMIHFVWLASISWMSPRSSAISAFVASVGKMVSNLVSRAVKRVSILLLSPLPVAQAMVSLEKWTFY